jgi:hypothetical protein
MAKYNKKKLEQEGEERRATRMHNSPYDKIWEALEELEAVPHPNEEQEWLRRFSGWQPLEHMMEGPAQDYLSDQHPTDKKIKVKGGPPSKD